MKVKPFLQKVPDPERILGITRSKGYFAVSWRYRDDRIARVAFKLKVDGKLVQIKRDSGFYYFKLPEQPMPKGFEPWRERKRHVVQNDRSKGPRVPVLQHGEEPVEQ